MKSYEMVEALSAKSNVTLEQAKDALEKTNWDILEAAIYIERNGIKKPTQQSVNTQPVGGAPTLQKDPQPNDQQNTQQSFQSSFEQSIHSGYQTPGGSPCIPENGYSFRFENVNTPQEGYSEFRLIGEFFGDLLEFVKKCFTNSFIVTQGSNQVAKIPIILFAFLFIVFFPLAVALLVIGLFTGCNYSFDGNEFDKSNPNSAINKTTNMVAQMKKDFKDGMNNTKQ